MTKEILKSYLDMKDEMAELNYKLLHMKENGFVGNSIINDYRSGYPIPQAVIGIDQKEYRRTKERYSNRIAELEKKCEEIEKYVESISDSGTRRIFRMAFLEGKKQKDIAKAVHMERSNISKKIDAYLKVSHNSQESHL